MNGWTLDPIADMYGPYFLVLYGCVSALTLLACWWMMSKSDPTAQMHPLPVPADPDPYEIAYLRGGENEVTRLAIFDLIERGYLQIAEGSSGRHLARVTTHPDSRRLPALLREVFDWFEVDRMTERTATAAEVFGSSSLPSLVKYHCSDYEQTMLRESLLYPEEAKESAWTVGVAGGLVITALGGYKLVVALEKGHSNVWFLVAMGVGALLVLLGICSAQRLSHRGRQYLENMQQAFEGLKVRAALAEPATPEPAMLLLVSLFGVAVLAGTSYASFHEEFQRSSSGAGVGGCGGGCGSGCGGGGCGGCGGCGE